MPDEFSAENLSSMRRYGASQHEVEMLCNAVASMRSEITKLKQKLKEAEEARYHGRYESPKTERWYTDGQGNYTKEC